MMRIFYLYFLDDILRTNFTLSRENEREIKVTRMIFCRLTDAKNETINVHLVYIFFFTLDRLAIKFI